MPLRNGKEYLLTFTCPTCKKFTANEVFGFRCSACSITDVKPACLHYQDPALLLRLKEWVDKNTFDSTSCHSRTIFRFLEKRNDIDCYRLLYTFRRHGVLLKAADAIKMLSVRGGTRRGHIIASCVRDWWNIKSPDVGGEWPHYLVCYYGRFDSLYVPLTIPVPIRAMLSCTETECLFRLSTLPLTRSFARSALHQ